MIREACRWKAWHRIGRYRRRVGAIAGRDRGGWSERLTSRWAVEGDPSAPPRGAWVQTVNGKTAVITASSARFCRICPTFSSCSRRAPELELHEPDQLGSRAEDVLPGGGAAGEGEDVDIGACGPPSRLTIARDEDDLIPRLVILAVGERRARKLIFTGVGDACFPSEEANLLEVIDLLVADHRRPSSEGV